MRLGKFRPKRTLLGLVSMILLLTVIRHYKAPNDDYTALSDILQLDRRLDDNLAGNILAGEQMMKQQNDELANRELPMEMNMTRSRKEREYKEPEKSDGSNNGDDMEEKNGDSAAADADVKPSEDLFLTDIRERANLIRHQCQELKDQIERENAVRSPPKGLIVDEKYKLMYCVVPKAACSSWKEFFFKLGGYAGDKTLRSKKRKQVLKYFDQISAEKRAKIYPKLYKFLFVRHPFLRLLSAYRDKMAPNGSYERLHAKSDNKTRYFWRTRLGWDIVQAYHGPYTSDKMKRNPEEYRITFKEFVKFLVEHPEHPYTQERHWNPMYKLCRPCDIKYQLIANFETIDTDSAFIRKLVKVDLPERNKHATNSSNLDFALKHYRDIPKDVMLKLYDRYEIDFKLFGYNPKPFL